MDTNLRRTDGQTDGPTGQSESSIAPHKENMEFAMCTPNYTFKTMLHPELTEKIADN